MSDESSENIESSKYRYGGKPVRPESYGFHAGSDSTQTDSQVLQAIRFWLRLFVWAWFALVLAGAVGGLIYWKHLHDLSQAASSVGSLCARYGAGC